ITGRIDTILDISHAMLVYLALSAANEPLPFSRQAVPGKGAAGLKIIFQTVCIDLLPPLHHFRPPVITSETIDLAHREYLLGHIVDPDVFGIEGNIQIF